MSDKAQTLALLPGEKFQACPILPEGYEVSNMGRVMSLQRVMMRSNGRKKTVAQMILANSISSHARPYYQVHIRTAGMRKAYAVHQLVALSFLPEGEPSSLVNHIDGNKLNNKVDNLEWSNHSKNLKHAYDNGLRTFNTAPAVAARRKPTA